MAAPLHSLCREGNPMSECTLCYLLHLSEPERGLPPRPWGQEHGMGLLSLTSVRPRSHARLSHPLRTSKPNKPLVAGFSRARRVGQSASENQSTGSRRNAGPPADSSEPSRPRVEWDKRHGGVAVHGWHGTPRCRRTQSHGHGDRAPNPRNNSEHIAVNHRSPRRGVSSQFPPRFAPTPLHAAHCYLYHHHHTTGRVPYTHCALTNG